MFLRNTRLTWRGFLCAISLACAVSLPAMAVNAARGEYDLIIRNGRIIDGTGSPWYHGDVAIRGDRIVAIGRLANATARKTIDAQGRIVAPGFIDMLGQSEMNILVAPSLPSKIYQGITTEITGEGDSIAPLDDQIIKNNMGGYKRLGIKPTWRTLDGYFARLEKQGIGINLGTYVGAASVRRMVLGNEDVQPTSAQLQQMQALVATAMQNGAMGLSSALQYTPGAYATTDELIALAKVASRYGGIYATHMRDEGNAEAAAIDEIFKISREAHIPVEIFHLKAAGKANWGKIPGIVAAIDHARAEGLDISADTYAYTAWGNSLASIVPPWAHAGGDAKLLARLKDPKTRAQIKAYILDESKDNLWNNEWKEAPGPDGIVVTSVGNPALRSLQGKRISDIAKAWHEDPLDAALDIVIKDDADTSVAVFGMDQTDVTTVLKQPWVSICNDSEGTEPWGILGKAHPHPRAYGTFPQIIQKYVEQQHALTLPDAIRKFTSLAAQRMGLTQRGVIKAGMYADIVVFDPAKVVATATFEQPNQLAKGMDYVIVNGVPVIADGKMTHALPGKVLRGPGYAPGK
ncbi:MAG: dihydroorotase [Lysobacterales bacterium 66-474]|nr:MAG: dihydroorotase [Rhodanobacter sp. SCN 66-43]OJY82888.1 MAG: dihydroorotase [Xanthomonadales bacterium 66-474]